jgi:hypothetical protein
MGPLGEVVRPRTMPQTLPPRPGTSLAAARPLRPGSNGRLEPVVESQSGSQFRAAAHHFACFACDLGLGLRDESHRSRPETHRVIRRAYLASHGHSRRALRWFYRQVRKVDCAAQVDPGALAALHRDGLIRLPGYLMPQTVHAMREYFERMPGRPIGGGYARGQLTKLADAARVPRLQYDPATVLGAPGTRELLADRRLQHLAAAYLGCEPIFAGINAWWSLADPGADDASLSCAAQLFHFDYDWPAFVKLFFYLTDVGPDDGPFVYVYGTHEHKREWREGRIDDAYIQRTYGAQVQPMTGRAGDLIVADTAGYHKGERVVVGPRLMLQLEFSVSRLGASHQYERYPSAVRPPSEYRHTFDVFCEPR